MISISLYIWEHCKLIIFDGISTFLKNAMIIVIFNGAFINFSNVSYGALFCCWWYLLLNCNCNTFGTSWPFQTSAFTFCNTTYCFLSILIIGVYWIYLKLNLHSQVVSLKFAKIHGNIIYLEVLKVMQYGRWFQILFEVWFTHYVQSLLRKM